jgi:DNA/RNA-binding domain of Phe-tRNA-synthetase-like protein
VNRLTDVYNAVSVLHQIPVGGEDLSRYAGPPRLIRAVGDEPFDTVADGVAVTEHPEAGEAVWCDDAGVTCRRWNWRQARRTQLREHTTAALFILDALDPVTGEALHAAADGLAARLGRLGPDVRSARRLIAGAGRGLSVDRDVLRVGGARARALHAGSWQDGTGKISPDIGIHTSGNLSGPWH